MSNLKTTKKKQLKLKSEPIEDATALYFTR